MNNSHKKPTPQAINLGDYASEILAEEDLPLFEDAVRSAEAGALRAAYLMIWLSCAESLKRRFYEAQQRDSSAEKIVIKIENKEKAQQAIDKYLLKTSCEYGFISASEQEDLNYIYKMRCLYAHPYEEAPSQEKVSHAAHVVVKYVLSRPVKFRRPYIEQLIKELLEQPSRLDDQKSAVEAYVKIILPKIDESLHVFLLKRYWVELEKIFSDQDLAIFFRRGCWFSQAVLKEVGANTLSHDDWHDGFRKFPKTLMNVCSTTAIFREIGWRAQDSLVSSIIIESKERASILRQLERLNANAALNERQQKRFIEKISDMSMKDVLNLRIKTALCYERIIKALKSRNWYIQNPAIELIYLNGPDQATELSENQQINLGRNILQTGHGGAGYALYFFEKFSQDETLLPIDVIRGIVLEMFTNEHNYIRFKTSQLEKVLLALDRLKKEQKKQLMIEVADAIKIGSPARPIYRELFAQVMKDLKVYDWTEPLVTSLKEKAPSITISY